MTHIQATIFSRTLPMLNSRAMNPNTQYCRDIQYPQIRTVLSRIKPLKDGTAGCEIYFFTDTEVSPQSREPACNGKHSLL